MLPMNLGKTKIVCDPDYEENTNIPDYEILGSDLCDTYSEGESILTENRIERETVEGKPIKARSKRQDRCIRVADLFNKAKNFCDSLFFTAITDSQFIQYVNDSLSDFYNLNPKGWNFSLSNPFQITLKDNKCAYELPEDFREISYVAGGDEPSNCFPAKQVFKVVPYHQWDTVQGGYFVSYQYDDITGNVVLFFRTPKMPKGCYNHCENVENMIGTLYVKYYRNPEFVEDFSDRICELPKHWGAEDILVQMIAQKIHAGKGKAYQLNETYINSLQALKRRDSNTQVSSAIYKNKKPNFLMNFSLSNQ